MEVCWPCRRALHEACRGSGYCSCNHASTPTTEVVTSEPDDDNGDEPTKRHRSQKLDASLKDQQSTGRKRAALAYPLDREGPCEWADAGPTNPKGGGTKPVIFGCKNTQDARHHGPDKNTLNNDEGNVHRICHWHHNNWHAMNDPDYQPGMLKAD